MLLELFGKQDLVGEQEARWLLETFAWSLKHFDAKVFFEEAVLVVPDNEHFPGRTESVPGMAGLVFDHVRRYAGMQHWPFRLEDAASCDLAATPASSIPVASSRIGTAAAATPAQPDNSIPVSYDPDLVADPEALIASFANALAYHLARTSPEPPPGGADYWPQATEVLAIFLGFGLMFANSSFSVPVRSCGSCGPKAQRHSFLTQHESTYALAIFCVLKEIPERTVGRHLKKHLRSFFRKCTREIEQKRKSRQEDALVLTG